jgi:glycine cleavage system P protein (glycine dehydrogenase)
MSQSIENFSAFEQRHIGPSQAEEAEMLNTIGIKDKEELIFKTIPDNIRLEKELDLPEALNEQEFLVDFKKIMSQNQVFRSYIGMGYYGTYVPTVILRNILENPGWYTAYTPYQAEISQGRLEMLLNFQTVVSELTGFELANASLLDEGTAAAEGMNMFYHSRKGSKKNSNTFFASDKCFPQTLDVLKTRASFLGMVLEIGDLEKLDLTREDLYGILIQYPDAEGMVKDYSSIIESAKECDLFVSVATDLMAIAQLKSPGEMGADLAVGSSQRFGVPMGYGGPHAGFYATKDQYKRVMPGRIIGVSQDRLGQPAFRMALQTREQHIRREKATSNICTAQVLLGVMAGAYAVYHGPERLKAISKKIAENAQLLFDQLSSRGYKMLHKEYFDTLFVQASEEERSTIKERAESRGINLNFFQRGRIGISVDETTREMDLKDLIWIFEKNNGTGGNGLDAVKQNSGIPASLYRNSEYMTEEVFQRFHSEHEMLRYLKRLENKDISLTHSMISLGSCTMKLNSTTEMIPVSWEEVGGLHPFCPKDQSGGYLQMFKELESWLAEITGFHSVSLQPNSGAQGEFTGLAVIAAYHKDNAEENRKIVLIPSSAHGTNPASGVMAGMEVKIVQCDERGNIDVGDLQEKANLAGKDLAGLMVTYPSTHGVFEKEIVRICEIIHEEGGQVYMDGANMNAQVGYTSPGKIGADVCHLNLHKTFCIPHGGGGPGVGPIGVAEHLSPFLPKHSVVKTGGSKGISAVSSGPFGSSSIFPISYAYIRMMGAEGLKNATAAAIMNANYIRARLEQEYKVLYVGEGGMSAHELIIDLRDFKPSGIEAEDVAKRLMDFGYHAPTMSFPVPGTLMIEPTESETKEELDRFCDTFIEIRKEIQEVIDGKYSREDNVLTNAPHPLELFLSEDWEHSYSREKAGRPLEFLKVHKIWPSVARIDNAYGDRNLICTCAPLESYES